jgi:hypothetical protein
MLKIETGEGIYGLGDLTPHRCAVSSIQISIKLVVCKIVLLRIELIRLMFWIVAEIRTGSSNAVADELDSYDDATSIME